MTPALRILAAFDGLPAESKRALGEALQMDANSVLAGLGAALTRGGVLAELTLAQVLNMARFDPASTELVESLGSDEPWRTVAAVLGEALAADDPDLEIASDRPRE